MGGELRVFWLHIHSDTRAGNKAQDNVSCDIISTALMSVELKSKLIGEETIFLFNLHHFEISKFYRC